MTNVDLATNAPEAASAMQVVIKVYLGWANTILKEEKEQAVSLSDFQDGRLLCLLADILTKSSLCPKWPHNSKHSEDEARKVIEGLFDYLRCEGAEVDVSAEEIMRAEETAILDILWLLMLHFCICDCELEPEEKCLAYGKLWLMDWIVEMLPSLNINPEKDELQSIFVNNHTLSQLIDKVCPDSAGRTKPEKPLLNLTYALMFAEDRLNMSQHIVKANEVVEGICPDYALVIYLALLKRKYDILNNSDSSSSQFGVGKRNNLFSDKEIILEERSKEEEQEMRSPNMEDLEDVTIGNIELQSSKSLHDELSERQLSMFQDVSHHEDIYEDVHEVVDDEDGVEDRDVGNIEHQPGSEMHHRNKYQGDNGAVGLTGSKHVLSITIPSTDRMKNSEHSLNKGSGESVSGNKSFEPFSDSIAEGGDKTASENKVIVNEDDDEDDFVNIEIASRDLQSAPINNIVSLTKLEVQSATSKTPIDNSTSEKQLPLSFSTKFSEKDTLPFSNLDAASPSKYSDSQFKANPQEFTDVSANKAVDTSDEELGTLKSEATGNRSPYITTDHSTKSYIAKKKLPLVDVLKETTNESNESIGPVGLSESSKFTRKSDELLSLGLSADGGKVKPSQLSLELSKNQGRETPNVGIAESSNNQSLGDKQSSQLDKVASSQQSLTHESLNGKFTVLPDRPVTAREAPTLKRSTSPPREKINSSKNVHRSHSKTTMVTLGTGESFNFHVENDTELKKTSANVSRYDKDGSAKSSRRGSFDSFSSELMYPPQNLQNSDLQPLSNMSYAARDSMHATPVHMIGVRASPSSDPLFQLLDNISKKGESLRNILAQSQLQSNLSATNQQDEDISRMEALNGIVKNLETQIEILGSENERLNSEIQRINISSPKFDGQNVSLNAQVEFLDEELTKYRKENNELKDQLDALRKNLIRQENLQHQSVKSKVPNNLNTRGGGLGSLATLQEGSQESLDKSFGSPRRLVKADSTEDAIVVAKETEIDRLECELQEVVKTNQEVVEELDRVKMLFTRSQIDELKTNIDTELEKAKRGESTHPKQTLEELKRTVERLEETVASHNDRLHHGILIGSGGQGRSKNGITVTLDEATARVRRKLNSDAAPQTYKGRVAQLVESEIHEKEEDKHFESPFVLSHNSSFAPVESSMQTESKNLEERRSRPFSSPPYPNIPKNSLLRPTATVGSANQKFGDLRRSAASLPTAFSSENSPTRTLSRESLKTMGHAHDAQVQTNLSVSSHFEPNKLSMSTQTQEEPELSSNFIADKPQQYDPNVSSRPYNPALLQTNAQMESAIEHLSYDALRSYTRNLSLEAEQGNGTLDYYLSSAFLYRTQSPHEDCNRMHCSNGSPRAQFFDDGVIFRDNNVASQTEPKVPIQGNKSPRFESFDRSEAIRAEFLLPRAEPVNKSYASNPNTNKRDNNIPSNLHGVIVDIVHDEVRRVTEEHKRNESTRLNENSFRSSPYSYSKKYDNYVPDFVPPLEELIMKKYKDDSSWKIPPSNIDELLLEYSIGDRNRGQSTYKNGFSGKSAMDRSFERRFGTVSGRNRYNNQHEVVIAGHNHNYTAPVSSSFERNAFCGVHESSSVDTHEHVSDSRAERYHTTERKSPELKGHIDRVGSSPESLSSPNKSFLSPNEFVNSLPVKLNFKRPPIVWKSEFYY